MNLQQCTVKTDRGLDVFGEYEGNSDSKNAIIFSHGFGVKRDSRGFFNELGNIFKHKYLVVRFDYVDLEGDNTIVKPFSVQASILEAIIQYTKQLFHYKNLTLISHSMGCFIPAFIKNLEIEKIILLAPPPSNPYKRLKKYFLKRKETIFDENATSSVKRSDGSLTFIPKEFWSELKSINPKKLYQKLYDTFDCYLIKPLQDEVIGEESYDDIKKLFKEKYFERNGSHNFEGKGREKLFTVIKQIIK